MAKKYILIDESIIDLIVEVECNYGAYSDYAELMSEEEPPVYGILLLRAISEYCQYGKLPPDYLENGKLMVFMNAIKEKLDDHIALLRAKGIIPQEFEEVD